MLTSLLSLNKDKAVSHPTVDRRKGEVTGMNQAVNRRSEFVDGRPPTPQMVTVEVDRLP